MRFKCSRLSYLVAIWLLLYSSMCYDSGLSFTIDTDKDLVDISNYNYPQPTDSDVYRIVIFGTNDLHGKIFPTTYLNQITNQTYVSGGASLISSYINILREQWNDRFLWLDAGDQFQGSMEFVLSNGTIMNDFFNFKKVDAIGIGNHEFDFGIEELKAKMKKSTFDYLSANIYNKKEQTYEFLPHQKRSKLFKLGKVKIGVIGLTTTDTPSKTSGNVKDLEFKEQQLIVNEEAKKLRSLGANAVILLNHFGTSCNDPLSSLFQLKIRTKDTQQGFCNQNSELNLLLEAIEPGMIDAVIGGHTHSLIHHWINGVPAMQTDGSSYSNIIYLAFDPLNNYKLIPDLSSIEGPLPSCLKVFENTKRCNYHSKEEIAFAGQLKGYIFHQKKVIRDTELDNVLKHWKDIIEEKAQSVMASNEAIQTYKPYEETTLANIVTDCCRRVTGAHIGFFSSGGFRTDWFPGYLNEIDLFDMFPFPSYYTTFEMTGEEIVRMITVMQEDKLLNPTSGIVQRVRKRNDGHFSLTRLALFDGLSEIQIELRKTYVICTSDFLANGGNFFVKIRKWYTLRNSKKYGQVRDYIREYLKNIKVIKENMFIDKDHPRILIQ